MVCARASRYGSKLSAKIGWFDLSGHQPGPKPIRSVTRWRPCLLVELSIVFQVVGTHIASVGVQSPNTAVIFDLSLGMKARDDSPPPRSSSIPAFLYCSLLGADRPVSLDRSIIASSLGTLKVGFDSCLAEGRCFLIPDICQPRGGNQDLRWPDWIYSEWLRGG